MPKLTDTQLVILTAAARREDGSILPLPRRIKLDAAAASDPLKSPIRRKLAAERPAKGSEAGWRALFLLVGQQLCISQARGIIDRHVQSFPANAVMAIDGTWSTPGNAVANTLDTRARNGAATPSARARSGSAVATTSMSGSNVRKLGTCSA